jgi:hypothetical protein
MNVIVEPMHPKIPVEAFGSAAGVVPVADVSVEVVLSTLVAVADTLPPLSMLESMRIDGCGVDPEFTDAVVAIILKPPQVCLIFLNLFKRTFT